MKDSFFHKYITRYTTDEEVDEIQDFLEWDKRKITGKTLDYVEKYGVYASLTSSPSRLKKACVSIAMVLECPYIRKIYVSLPDKFRNKEKYRKKDMEFIQNMSDRVVIRRFKNDIGPASKVIPTLSAFSRGKKRKAIIISIDDDIAYPPTLFNELIYYAVKHPKIVFGGSGFRWGYLDTKIDRKQYWPEKKKPRHPNVDVIEGWGAVAYKRELVDTTMIRKLARKNIQCKLSDDLTISYTLAKNKVKRRVINSVYFSDGEGNILPLAFGEQGDALQFGGGLDENPQEGVNINIRKIHKCLASIKYTNRVLKNWQDDA